MREYLDDTVQPGEAVGTAMGLPVLATIPAASSVDRVERGRGPGAWRPLRLPPSGRTEEEGESSRWPRIDRAGRARQRALAEAFSGLRTSVLFGSDSPPPRSLLVSSCRPGEGKTTVSLNLALSLARLDLRVLLVNADLRRPDLHRALRTASEPGLADYLANELDWRPLVQQHGPGGLHVLPSGVPVDDAGDLLSNGRAERLIREAERAYDVVVLDAPALFVNVPDARLLAEIIPAVLIVVRSGTTPRPLAERVGDAVPNVLGVIVNDVDTRRLPAYDRTYFEPYEAPVGAAGDDEEDGLGRTRARRRRGRRSGSHGTAPLIGETGGSSR